MERRPGVTAILFLLCRLFLLTVNAAQHAATAAPIPQEATKVKVSVYYESKCPDSRKFILGQLYPVWTDLKDIIYLDLHAYGKTVEYHAGEDYRYRCQHGDEECLSNIMLTCAKNYITEEAQFLNFTKCVMQRHKVTHGGLLCANDTGVKFDEIQRCYTSHEGRQLQHQVATLQNALTPTLYYVPWILINDAFTRKQLDAAETDLRTVVCDAYQGVKPDLCHRE